MIVPCRGCADRVVGCHGNCEKYAAFKAEIEKIRKIKSFEALLRQKPERLRKWIKAQQLRK